MPEVIQGGTPGRLRDGTWGTRVAIEDTKAAAREARGWIGRRVRVETRGGEEWLATVVDVEKAGWGYALLRTVRVPDPDATVAEAELRVAVAKRVLADAEAALRAAVARTMPAADDDGVRTVRVAAGDQEGG